MAAQFANLAEARKYIAQNVDPPEQAALKITKEIQNSGELVALSKAIDARQVEVAQMHAKLVERQVKKAESGLAAFQLALDRLQKVLDADIDFEADAKKLEVRLKRIGESKDLLARVIAQANDFLADFAKMAKAVGSSDTATLADWSRTIASIRRIPEAIEDFNAQARKLTLASNDAVSTRDSGALGKCQAEARKIQDRLRKDPPAALVKQMLLAFQKAHDPKAMSPTVLTQFSRDVREATEIAAGVAKRYEVTLGQLELVFKQQIGPPDAARAIKVLGLKSAVLDDLKKALKKADDGADASAIKELDLIAKDGGLKIGGKDMLARLRREKVL